ncbi:FAD binding domain-containing protein [Beauveria bassiana ARSEF 2860]|uniref:FAD binding domain-containing protein n=1 Tax=Beauveria bassiana (strain ARSEF 2860) TaxID=655819 RepID=J5JE11_BEAB2|nr:FAD binding domain-containing protein [Beauveria bassiana ARSEF 2860]EJP61986.1 FAD binding domain-containing protein [Beauveria bassiana ARSEF 2860]
MGNTPSTPPGTCLNAICAGRDNCVAYPSDVLYQANWVKPYNLDVPVTPAAVFRPNNAADVSEAIRCAGANDVHVQAKSGGHSFANFGLGGADGGLMIDLQNLNHFSMDTSNWHATLGSGFVLGELDKQLHANGKRAMAHGVCPGVGIGGHATIGGIGSSSRMWGTALDHVLEVEVVTADGKIQRASKTENADLFWSLQGAGASFGVITEFVVRTEEEPGSVVEYTYSFSFDKQSEMAPVYKKWQDLVGNSNLDRRFTSLFIVQPLGVLITGTFYGTLDEYKASGIPDKLPAAPANITVMDWLGSLAHIAEKTALYLANVPTKFVSRSLALREEDLLGEQSIDELFNYMENTDADTPLWSIIFDNEGGAISDVPDNSTAYPHRDKIIMYQSLSVGLLGVSDKMVKFVDGVQKLVQKGAPNAHTTYAGYINANLDRKTAQKFYWGHKLPQLQQLKKKFDPTSLFRNPQSVDPAE